jgi:hypothetical protein
MTMDGRNKTKLKKSKPATKLNLGHELRTTDSETKLCKRLSEGCRSERVKKFCGFFVDYRTETK